MSQMNPAGGANQSKDQLNKQLNKKEKADASARWEWWEPVVLVLLFWYPLRHIYRGLDLWDTGYNYANFLYMGTDHMDSMWLFSTYLSNAAGNLLTRLPMAGTLAGMNLYTGLFASVLAVMGYLFCTRKLGIPGALSFIGEFAALSLCWCPTALLYNYMTYVLFTGCVMLLYVGLTERKKWCLFGAGICLGANVLVRFSNLPEAALILAVWLYAFLEGRENRDDKRSGFVLAVNYTLWCLAGYLAVLAVLFGWIQIRYGMDEYLAGISRLFAMTDKATDYKAGSMVKQLVMTYVDNLYWIFRIGVISFVGIVGFAVAERLAAWIEQADNASGFVNAKAGENAANNTGRQADADGKKRLPESRFFLGELQLIWSGVTVLMICWLYMRGFCSMQYDNYGAILRPGISFLTLTLGICVIRILQRGVGKGEKLLSALVFLTVLLTSIGSNNGIYPSLNHLFIAAPYTLCQCWRFVKDAEDLSFRATGKKQRVWGFEIRLFPVKMVLIVLIFLFLYQSGRFGWSFVFAEATGAKNMSVMVDNNETLKGVQMSPERARWMREISEYVTEHGLEGRELIPFGSVPAMSFYLKMPAAFNPWSDLDSYNEAVMWEALKGEMEKVRQGGKRPVVLLEASYAMYMMDGEAALRQAGLQDKAIEKIREKDGKIQRLKIYIEDMDYGVTFTNEKFVLME